MATMKDAKMLGGIGAILSLLSFVPRVGTVLAIAGLVLVLVAVKYISDVVNEPKIFKDVLMAVIIEIVGVVLLFTVVFAAFLSPAFWASIMRPRAAIFTAAGVAILGLVALWVCLLIGAVLIKRAYERIAELTKVDLFKTTGLLYLIGAALTIIIVGLLVTLVAKILEAVSFFSLPETYPPVPPPPPPPPAARA